jgi:hypothetical protein
MYCGTRLNVTYLFVGGVFLYTSWYLQRIEVLMLYITFVIYIWIMSLYVVLLICGWVSCAHVRVWPVAVLGLFIYDLGGGGRTCCSLLCSSYTVSNIRLKVSVDFIHVYIVFQGQVNMVSVEDVQVFSFLPSPDNIHCVSCGTLVVSSV